MQNKILSNDNSATSHTKTETFPRTGKLLRTAAIPLLLTAPFIVSCSSNKQATAKHEINPYAYNDAKKSVVHIMGIDEIRTSLSEGAYGLQAGFKFATNQLAGTVKFWDRQEQAIWTDHHSAEILGFVTKDRIEKHRNEWPENIKIYSYSATLVLPSYTNGTSERSFDALLHMDPEWLHSGENIKKYARTTINLNGFYITQDGKQVGDNVLIYAAISSYDKNLPEGELNGALIYIARGKRAEFGEGDTTPIERVQLDEVGSVYPFALLEEYYKQAAAMDTKWTY